MRKQKDRIPINPNENRIIKNTKVSSILNAVIVFHVPIQCSCISDCACKWCIFLLSSWFPHVFVLLPPLNDYMSSTFLPAGMDPRLCVLSKL